MIRVREACLPDDAAAILAIDRGFSTDTVFDVEAGAEAIVLRLRALPTPILKRFPLDDLDDPARPWNLGLVALDGDRLIGFAAVGFRTWNARLVLWHFYVDAAFRGRGAGRALIERVMGEAVRNGADHVWLETSNHNVPGIAAYQRLGFTLCGADTLLYAGTEAAGETALFYARET